MLKQSAFTLPTDDGSNNQYLHTDGSGVTSWRTIDQVGTISSGTWNGAIIGVPYGGTGTATGSIEGTATLNFTTQSNNNIQLLPNGTGPNNNQERCY